jgi:hypothetical protein
MSESCSNEQSTRVAARIPPQRTKAQPHKRSRTSGDVGDISRWRETKNTVEPFLSISGPPVASEECWQHFTRGHSRAALALMLENAQGAPIAGKLASHQLNTEYHSQAKPPSPAVHGSGRTNLSSTTKAISLRPASAYTYRAYLPCCTSTAAATALSSRTFLVSCWYVSKSLLLPDALSW